jgi:hypothetical protein
MWRTTTTRVLGSESSTDGSSRGGEGLLEEVTGSNRKQRPDVWTESLLCKTGLDVPAGLLVVEGHAEGCGKIMQSMQRVLRQKRQMFFCERGRQAWHAQWRGTGKQVYVCRNSNSGRNLKNVCVSEIHVKKIIFARGRISAA